MIEIYEVQSTLVTQIQTGPSDDSTYFTSETVVAEDGLQRDTIETAMNTRGFCVVVGLPLDGNEFESTGVSTLTEIVLPVMVSVNPEVNSSAAGKNVLEALDKTITAILEYSPNDEADKFRLDAQPYELVTKDGGEVSYVIWVRKIVAHSTKN